MIDSTLLSIKQFSKLAGVAQSTLRYYDDIGLLPAAARGEENNYRYYTPLQLTTLRFINVLVALGVPLATVNEMVQNRTPESIIELLSQQEAMLDRRLHELQTAYSTIHVIRRNIQNGLLGRPGEVRVESLDEIKFVLGPANDFGDDKTYYRTFERFCSSVNEYRINLDYPIGGYYYDMDSFLKTPGRPNKYFSMDPAGNCTRPAGTYLVGYNQGYYGNLRDLPQKMAAYAQEHELVFSGPVYVVYLLNEISTKDSDQYLSRISVSVSTKRNNHSFVPSRTADEKYG